MKHILGLLAVAILSTGLALSAQNGNPPQNPPGPAGAPHAWCDKNGDGLCDFTGKPVGQCDPANCPGCQGKCPRQGQGGGQGNPSCPRNRAARK